MSRDRRDRWRGCCRRSLASVLSVASVTSVASLPAQDPWPALDRAAAAYASLTSLAADFVQIIDHPVLGAPDTTTGRLYLRPPDRFAMRFADPAGDRIVADGEYLWLYTPSTTANQVIRTSAIPRAGGVTPNLFGQFVDRPRERYRARWVRAVSESFGTLDVVALVPTDSAAPYREATIWVSRSDGLLRRVDIEEATGQRRSVMLRNVRTNVTIPARELRFDPPAGTRIVDQ